MKTSKDLKKAIKDYKSLKAANGLTDVDKSLYGIIKVLIDEIVELNGEIETISRRLNKVM